MASSMENILISDIPQAVLKAKTKPNFCLNNMNVSKIIDVIIPLIIARDMINKIGIEIEDIWK